MFFFSHRLNFLFSKKKKCLVKSRGFCNCSISCGIKINTFINLLTFIITVRTSLNQRDKAVIMDKIPSWIEKLLLPKLNEITGEIKAIHTRIDAVEKEIVSLRNEMVAKFEVADVKIEIASMRNETVSLRNEMITKFEAVDSNVASLRNEMITKFEAVDSNVASLRNEMISRFEAVDARFNALEVRIPAWVELEEFEARLLEVEKKLATV